MSNSKVSSLFGITKSVAKNDVNDFLRDFPNSSFHYNENDGITILVTQMFPGADVMRVSMAIMSMDEVKFRKSVGNYIAVCNMSDGSYINVPTRMILEFLESMGIEY